MSALLRGITSKHVVDFYCFNCLHSFIRDSKLKSYKKVCDNKKFCGVLRPSEDTKILDFNQYRKSDNTPSIIYAYIINKRKAGII